MAKTRFNDGINNKHKKRIKRDNSNPGNGLLAMRSHTETSFKTPNGTHKPLKTSHHTTLFTPTTQEGLDNQLTETVASHRPCELSPGQTTGITPGGTTLQATHFGAFTLLSNFTYVSPLRKKLDFNEAADDDFYQSEAYQAIKDINIDKKQQEIIISKALLDKSEKRKSTQNAVMAKKPSLHRMASATNYATPLFTHQCRFEWLHMIAHMIAGNATQHDGNLVAGTAHANTNMMLIEGELQTLAEHYPQGFKLSVEATLIPGTHIAKEITYTITTDDFTLPFIFDAQTNKKPHYQYKSYAETIIQTLLEKHTSTSTPKRR